MRLALWVEFCSWSKLDPPELLYIGYNIVFLLAYKVRNRLGALKKNGTKVWVVRFFEVPIFYLFSFGFPKETQLKMTTLHTSVTLKNPSTKLNLVR